MNFNYSACDSDWDSMSQYCMYFNSALVKTFVVSVMTSTGFSIYRMPRQLDEYDFQEGNEVCQKMNAFLADDLSEQKHEWLTSEIIVRNSVQDNPFRCDAESESLVRSNFRQWQVDLPA